ncbi:MAG TPA: PAS domain-containing protein, partial [Acidimicrobiales bacterium]|nr:PAS domain-containing protein [Acidimicrobiales bacterium]
MTSPIGDRDPLRAIVVLGLLEAAASDVTTLCSPEGEFLYVSAAVGPVLGWTAAELTGRRTDEFIHPDERDAARMGRSAALRTVDTVITTQRFLARDGGYLWTESATRQILDDRAPG